MGIEEIVDNCGPYCLHDGRYMYRAKGDVDHPDVYYCALSETRCRYYVSIKNKEYCDIYNKSD